MAEGDEISTTVGPEDPEHHDVVTNGVRLHTVQAGPSDGRPLVLLHGFPELWRAWREQIGPLARAGYRVVVPDQRGYNTSDKPRGRAAYDIAELAADILGILDANGWASASIAGHDWGAFVAWWLALHHADRLERLIIVNVPHPTVFRRHLLNNPRQRRRSWYIRFFQLPWLPELTVRALGARALDRTSRPGTFSAAELTEYRRAWRQPGALRGMINWYRAASRMDPGRLGDGRITVPTLIVWGVRDTALVSEMAEESLELCETGRLERFEEATHWILHEEPAAVSALIRKFLSASS